MNQTEATIFLAEQRGCSQTDGFRSFHGFNFGAYQAENRTPFGSLRVFNDDTLAGEKSMPLQADDLTDVIVLPLVGAIEYRTDLGETGFLEAGQVQVFPVGKGKEYTLTNPYAEALINFLQIWIKRPAGAFVAESIPAFFDFEQKNQLIPLFSTIARGFIGRYDGRTDDVYQLTAPDRNGVFVFVIEGAFEVQNRLLHRRDGLSLTHVSEIDFEALSNDAMLLLLEVPL
ncbi:MAG: pirin family protein [Spirosomataceae bacterium]